MLMLFLASLHGPVLRVTCTSCCVTGWAIHRVDLVLVVSLNLRKSPRLALSTLLPASNSILVQSPSFSTRSSECPASSQQHGQSGKFGKFLHLSEQHTTRTLGCASFALQPAFSQLHSPTAHVYLLHQNFTPFNQFDETLCQNFNLTNFGSLLYHYPISLPHAQEKHARFFRSRTPENRPRISSCFFVAVVGVFLIYF